MKTNKIFLLALAAGAMVLGSCSNDDELTNEKASKPATMVFTASMENAGDVQRSALSGNAVHWSADDQITIFNSETTSGVTFTAVNPSGATSTFTGIIDEATPYYAVYPAQTGVTTLSGTAITGVTLPANQTAVAGSYDPQAAVMVGTASSEKDFSFKNLNCLIKVNPQFDCSKIILDANGTDIAGTVTVNAFTPDGDGKIAYTVTDGASTVTLNSPEGSYIQAGQTYYIAILPTTTSASGFKITFVATESNDDGLFGFAKSKSAACTFARNEIVNFGEFSKTDCSAENAGITKNGSVPCVDLGLSTGALWAKTNVGYTAAKPYGDFFAWGDTEPLYESYTINFATGTSNSGTTVTPTWKSGKEAGYSWANYDYSDGTNETGAQPYTGGVLNAANDAATVKLGSNWSTPTMTQITTLRTECVWVYGSEQHGSKTIAGFKIFRAKNAADKGKIYFTQNSKWYELGSSANGYYQSTTDASVSAYMTETTPVATYNVSDTHIFLPSSGYFSGAAFYYGAWNGFYWSSTRNSATNARYLSFGGSYVSPQYYGNRCTGRTVRGVCQ